MASLGAASGMGLVLGPAAAAWLSQFSLSAPLYGMALLPLLAWAALWRALPREPARPRRGQPPIRLADVRLRRPMAVAFVAMFARGHRADHSRLLSRSTGWALDAAAAARWPASH